MPIKRLFQIVFLQDMGIASMFRRKGHLLFEEIEVRNDVPLVQAILLSCL